MTKLKLLFSSLMILVAFNTADAKENVPTPTEAVTTNTSDSVLLSDSTMSATERKVREAAVKVGTPTGGHGSGSYLKHKDFYFVLTAQHVADGEIFSHYIIEKNDEMMLATLVWSDAVHDIAVLMLPEQFKHIKPMDFDPTDAVPEVGSEISYSGYPSSHQLMTIRGRIAGYEHKRDAGLQIILHTYGWFGCSGSVIYNRKGEIVGVLWGVDVEYYPDIAVIEDMIWVIPVHRLKMDEVKATVCNSTDFREKNSRFCK